MVFYRRLLKFYGLRSIISKVEHNSPDASDSGNQETQVDQQLVIEVDTEDRVEERVEDLSIRFYQKGWFRKFVNSCHYIFFVAILSWPIFYSVIQAIKEDQFRYFSSNMNAISFLIQFIVGHLYFKSGHFKTVTPRDSRIDRWYNFGFGFALILSFCLSITVLVLVFTGGKMGIYSEMNDNISYAAKPFYGIAVLLTMFFGYNITFANFVIFTTVFIKHCLKISEYSEKLEEFVDQVTDELTIESVIQEYSDLKTEHTKSVQNLNNIFSLMTILGILGAYFLTMNFGTDFITVYNYIDIVWFVILEAVYIYTITTVKNSVGDILNVVNSPRFVLRYLERLDLETFEANSDSVSTTSQLEKIVKSYNNICNQTQDLDNKIGNVKDICIRSMIKSHENAESLDWIILNSKLNSSWESFQVMGFDMDDETLLKKTVAIVFGVIMMIRLDTEVLF